jgi:hypothetical protein
VVVVWVVQEVLLIYKILLEYLVEVQEEQLKQQACQELAVVVLVVQALRTVMRAITMFFVPEERLLQDILAVPVLQ